MNPQNLEQANTQIEFVNMKPWSDLKVEGDTTMEKIETQSPSDANVKGALEQVDGGYLCHIAVVSPIWKFDVKEFARNPLTALHRAARSVEQELSLWKKWRFIGA
jgi:hypothetical protein